MTVPAPIVDPAALPLPLASHRAVRKAAATLAKAKAGVADQHAFAAEQAAAVRRAVDRLDEAEAQRLDRVRQSAELGVEIAQRRVEQAQAALADAVQLARIDVERDLHKRLRLATQRWLAALVAAGEAVVEVQAIEASMLACGVPEPYPPFGGAPVRGHLRVCNSRLSPETPLEYLLHDARAAGYSVPTK